MNAIENTISQERNKRFYFLIVLLLLAVSGFPSFMSFRPFICLLIPILYYKLKKRNISIPKIIYKIVFFVFIFCLIHLFLDHFSLIGSITFFLDIITYSLTILLMRDQIGEVFVRVMKFLSLIALFFWLCIVLFPGIYVYLTALASLLPQFITDAWAENTSNSGVSLYLYFLPTNAGTFVNGLFRNCGPFFEPGLFASYLTIALLLSLQNNKILFSKSNIVLALAILSTFSSAGYVSFALVVIYIALFSKSRLVKILYFVVILFLWQPVMNLEFMSEKITNNMSESSDKTDSRFGAMLYHAEKIVESPIIGFAGGKLPKTKMDSSLGLLSSERVLSPNGLSLVFVFWGIPLGLLYYIYLYKSVRLFCFSSRRSEVFFVFLILLSTAFSQTITNGPIILIFVLYAIIKFYEKRRFENRGSSYLQFPL